MTQEQIIALDSKKHIKIWLLHKQGLTRRQIADLLGTNPGHVGNEIKAYSVNKEKREAAEALTNTKDEKNGNKKEISIEEAISYTRAGAGTAKKKQPGGLSNESAYQKASKIPKGGTVNATPDNLAAWSAETIAKKHAMQPEAIFNWAKKHGVDLTKHGHILSKVESNSALLADVLNDKYEDTKKIIESGPTLEYPVYQNDSNGKQTLVKTFPSHKEAEDWVINKSRQSEWYFYRVGIPIQKEKVKTPTKDEIQDKIDEIANSKRISYRDAFISFYGKEAGEFYDQKESEYLGRYTKSFLMSEDGMYKAKDAREYANHETADYFYNKKYGSKLGNGGILEGPKHGSGGIKATLPDGNPIELEGGEIIINAKAAKENCAELSKINQSAGNGLAFPCNNPALDGVQGPMNGNGAKIKTSISEELINSLTSDAQTWEDVKPVSNEIAKANIEFLKSLPEFEYGDSSSPKYNPVDYKNPFIWLMFRKVYLIIPSGLKYNKYVGDITSFWKNIAGEGAKIEAEHEDLYNELASLIPGGMPLSKEAFFEKIAKKHIKEDPDYYKKLEKYVEGKVIGDNIGSPNTKGAYIWSKRTQNLIPDTYRYLKWTEEGNLSQETFENDIKQYLNDEWEEVSRFGDDGENTAYPNGGDNYLFSNGKQQVMYSLIQIASKGTKVSDASKKPYFLLTQAETVSERDRLEANNTDPQRLQDLCRYSYTKFKTLLKDLK